MPWIDSDRCTGCGLCVKNCPVSAISFYGEQCSIDTALCVRCGSCHDICPNKAVRHDSELVTHQVKENVDHAREKACECSRILKSTEEGRNSLERFIKHFNKEKAVIDETLIELDRLKGSLFR